MSKREELIFSLDKREAALLIETLLDSCFLDFSSYFVDFEGYSNSPFSDWMKEYGPRVRTATNTLLKLKEYFPDCPAFKCGYDTTWKLSLKLKNRNLKTDEIKDEDFHISQKNVHKTQYEQREYSLAMKEYKNGKQVEIVEDDSHGSRIKKAIIKKEKDTKNIRKRIKLELCNEELNLLEERLKLDYDNSFYDISDASGYDESMKKDAKAFLNILEKFRTYIHNIKTEYDELKKHLESLSKKQEGLNEKPDNAFSWYRKGQTLECEGKEVQAINCYQKAYELDSKNITPLLNIAYLYQKRTEYERALEYYDKISKQELSDEETELIFERKAVLCYEQNKLDKALKYINKAIDIIQSFSNKRSKNNTLPRILNKKGLILDRMGKHGGAIECYKKGLEFKPSDICCLFNLAQLYERFGKNAEALEIYKKLISVSDNPEYWFYGSLLLLKMKRYSEGINLLKKAIKLKLYRSNFSTQIQRLKELSEKDSKLKSLISGEKEIKQLLCD